MKKICPIIFIFFTLLITVHSCRSVSKLYHKGDKNRISTGSLSATDYGKLIQILDTTTSSKVKDTIIIKYDYNKDICWNSLDQKNDDYIKYIMAQNYLRVKNILNKRSDISLFNFREPGNDINKIKRWDESIHVDSENRLFNLVFSQRSICGNSMLIMPDRQFIFIRSDSHIEALDLTQNKIKEILNNQ